MNRCISAVQLVNRRLCPAPSGHIHSHTRRETDSSAGREKRENERKKGRYMYCIKI